ncbi:MAG: SOS response-associated peptidase family protein [Lachnospiraceae bacterium]|nr:SOS response-associated peptidase family protein [Lachnospiraceae bacterium]
MCCRFFIDEETINDIQRIVAKIDVNVNTKRTGDIYPSDTATIIAKKNRNLYAEDMRWGFPSYYNSQLMINARAESALQKQSFSESVLYRRCIVPAKKFYEWDASKTKVTFTYPESPSIYMAGFYHQFQGEQRFIVLTTAANDSMKRIHDRMPLILRENQIEEWIFADHLVDKYLKLESPMLTKYQEYEQMSFLLDDYDLNRL